MIFQDLEFFNVDHMDLVAGMNGFRLERFPEKFRNELGILENHNGRFRAERVHGCEIRFVTEAGYFDIALTAVEADIDICIFYGDRFHQKNILKAGQCTVIHVAEPEIYKTVDLGELPKGRFAPYVWRIQFGMNGFAYFNYLDTYGCSHRPPSQDEKPAILWAAYGSSITCGSVATGYSNCYIEQAAVLLGADVMNKGLSGSCLCEPFAAEYLSELDVDMITAEIGVNMIMPFSVEEFTGRVSYFLKALEKSQANHIDIIDVFSNKGIIAKDHSSDYYVKYRSFKEITRRLLADIGDGRFILIPGEKIVKDFTYLSTDLLHPSDHGHIQMGYHLAEYIKKAHG